MKNTGAFRSSGKTRNARPEFAVAANDFCRETDPWSVQCTGNSVASVPRNNICYSTVIELFKPRCNPRPDVDRRRGEYCLSDEGLFSSYTKCMDDTVVAYEEGRLNRCLATNGSANPASCLGAGSYLDDYCRDDTDKTQIFHIACGSLADMEITTLTQQRCVEDETLNPACQTHDWA